MIKHMKFDRYFIDCRLLWGSHRDVVASQHHSYFRALLQAMVRFSSTITCGQSEESKIANMGWEGRVCDPKRSRQSIISIKLHLTGKFSFNHPNLSTDDSFGGPTEILEFDSSLIYELITLIKNR